jgi:phosphoesterase RecJ-like protein
VTVSYRVQPPADLVQALSQAKRVALVTHLNPDGDGLGAESALALALESLGKQVVVFNNDATPAQYAFLGLEERRAPALPPIDLVVALDCPVLERLGAAGKAAFDAAPASVVIDHHVPKEAFGQRTWISTDCCATGEMMEPLIAALGVALSPAMATGLYAALVNDTGCFHHSNTDQWVFECAARLLKAGADSAGVNRRLLDEKPLGMVRLQAHVLDRLTVIAGGRAALVAVGAEDLKAFGAGWEDTDGLAEGLRSIAGVEVSAMLREEGPAKAKLSLRSKFAFDVNVFAGQWGGGGHAKAAGATIPLPLPQAVAAVASALEKALA